MVLMMIHSLILYKYIYFFFFIVNLVNNSRIIALAATKRFSTSAQEILMEDWYACWQESKELLWSSWCWRDGLHAWINLKNNSIDAVGSRKYFPKPQVTLKHHKHQLEKSKFWEELLNQSCYDCIISNIKSDSWSSPFSTVAINSAKMDKGKATMTSEGCMA